MRQRIRSGMFLGLLGAMVLAVAPTWADAPEDALVTALRTQRMTLNIEGGALHGSGAQWLIQHAAQAQFVLIGEDHGFADVPEFAMALQASLGAQRFDYLVLEVGPYSTERVETELRADAEGLAKINRQFPFSMPFLNLREDGALAASFIKPDTTGAVLWGIDQEFLLSTQSHLQALLAMARTQAQRRALRVYRDQSDAAWREMIEKHTPEAAGLLRWQKVDLAALRDIFTDPLDAKAQVLIDAMAHSAKIYRSQNTTPFQSNRERSQLMKRQFMQYYQAALAADQLPRVLFKMGAYHAGRGLTPTRLFDIGNMASELAEANGRSSLHILVLAAGGEVNRYFPFSVDRKDQKTKYIASEELKQIDAQLLLDAAADNAITLFDLSALRDYGQPSAPPGSAFAAMIFNYDAVVMIPNARAATNFD
jgi:hypothetical protein